jgi:16S rRNA (guanine966-N2)-methyltransferase
MLTPKLPGARFLDLYAGSGSLGLEAASRGAAEVHWVEQHGATVRLLEGSIRKLAPAGVTCKMMAHRDDVLRYLARSPVKGFDIICADPPYADIEKEGAFVQLMDALQAHELLAPSGLFILESYSRWKAPELKGWTELRRKTYGTSAVTFFEQIPT